MNPDPNTNPNPNTPNTNAQSGNQPQNSTPQTSSIVPELGNETPMSIEKKEESNVTPKSDIPNLPPLNFSGNTSFLSQPDSKPLVPSESSPTLPQPSQEKPSIPVNPVEAAMQSSTIEKNSASTTPTQENVSSTYSNNTTQTPKQMIATNNNQTKILLIAGALGVIVVLVVGGVLLFSNIPTTQSTVQTPVITEELIRETQPSPTTLVPSEINAQEYIAVTNNVKTRLSQVQTAYPVNISNNNINTENVKSASKELYSIREGLSGTVIGNQTATQLNTELIILIDQMAKLHDEIVAQLGTGTSLNPQARTQVLANYNNLNNSINAKLNEISEKLQTITIQ